MFTVEQRDALQVRLPRSSSQDPRVVAAAVVGSLAADGGGDRWSDVDFTVSVAGHVAVDDVLDDWTRGLVDELEAVHLVDLGSGATTYRVLLLPGALQLDLSMTAAPEPDGLRAALAASVRALVHLGSASGLPHASTVARRLTELS